MGKVDGESPAPRMPPGAEYEEITLSDIVVSLYRRKFLLVTIFGLCMVGGVAATMLTTTEYESTAAIIPIAHSDIIKNWFTSQQAAEVVVADVGDPLLPALFYSRWDDASESWNGAPPTPDEAATELVRRVKAVRPPTAPASERILEISVEIPRDPVLARRVTDAYVDSLAALRPQLENLTAAEMFGKIYSGTNEEEARHQARIAAQSATYWIQLDAATLPDKPSKPDVILNIAASGLLGTVLGVVSVFVADWITRFRAERRALVVPVAPETRAPETAPGRLNRVGPTLRR